MHKIALVGTDTPRARGYAASLEKAGLGEIIGIFYGKPQPEYPLNTREKNKSEDIWMPPLNESIHTLFTRKHWIQKWIPSDTINTPHIVEALKELKPALMIFAGRGGEIVDKELLNQGIPMLHCHPGSLPDQRGSTTIYYSILERKPITVSALLLSPEIDAGQVLMEQQYPYPPYEMDLDILFDCAIRSDLLIKIITYFVKNGTLPTIKTDCLEQENSNLYYVIHPLLKHLAWLSLKK